MSVGRGSDSYIPKGGSEKGLARVKPQPDEDPIHTLPRARSPATCFPHYQMWFGAAFLLTWYSMDLIMFVHWVAEMFSGACA